MRWLWLVIVLVPQILLAATSKDTIKGAPGTVGVVDTWINYNAVNTNYSTSTILWARGDYPTSYKGKILIAPVGFKHITDSLTTLGYTMQACSLSIYDSLFSISGLGDVGAWTFSYRLAKPQKFAWATWNRWEDSTSTPNDSAWTGNGVSSEASVENGTDAGGDYFTPNLISLGTSISSGRQKFDITSLATKWANGTATERGLVMSFGDGYEWEFYPDITPTANSVDSIGVCATECSDATKRPMFIIYSQTSSSPARRRRMMTFGDNAAQEWREKYCWRYEQ